MQRIQISVRTSLSSPTLPAFENEHSDFWASRQAYTQSQSHIRVHTCTAGESNDTNKNWHKTHFHSVFNTHKHAHTCTGKTDKTGIIGYETTTRAVNDWPQQVCVDRLAALSLYVLSGLALRFPAGPCCTTLGTTSKPWHSENQVKPASITSVPAVPMLHTHTHTHQPMHRLHIYIWKLDRIFKKYNQN